MECIRKSSSPWETYFLFVPQKIQRIIPPVPNYRHQVSELSCMRPVTPWSRDQLAWSLPPPPLPQMYPSGLSVKFLFPYAGTLLQSTTSQDLGRCFSEIQKTVASTRKWILTSMASQCNIFRAQHCCECGDPLSSALGQIASSSVQILVKRNFFKYPLLTQPRKLPLQMQREQMLPDHRTDLSYKYLFTHRISIALSKLSAGAWSLSFFEKRRVKLLRKVRKQEFCRITFSTAASHLRELYE